MMPPKWRQCGHCCTTSVSLLRIFWNQQWETNHQCHHQHHHLYKGKSVEVMLSGTDWQHNLPQTNVPHSCWITITTS